MPGSIVLVSLLPTFQRKLILDPSLTISVVAKLIVKELEQLKRFLEAVENVNR